MPRVLLALLETISFFSTPTIDVEPLEFNGQIVTFEVQNTSVSTGVSIKKTGPVQAVPGQPIRYVFSQIKNSSKPGQIVLDLFGGSGSTLIACEQMNRRCFTMVFDPQYADVIIDRWQQFTGRAAVKLN